MSDWKKEMELLKKKKIKDLVKNKKFVAKILENSQISQRR